MIQFCSIDFYDKLRNFDEELERGCSYKVSANIAHKTGIAILEGPYVELAMSGITYHVVPVDAIKHKYFNIKKGEIGDLVDATLSEGVVKFFRVIWKQAIQVYYSNPSSMPLKTKRKHGYLQLEEIFSVQKIEPKDTKTTRA